ncbi:hypothetical protein [Paraburkholderia phenazinium]|uniref:Uncharacterized protein n=1 Tax=Paraburkholderia phenazinium TaxID=60549 RepID=A0A1G8FJG4_9BURK|nr:hypothetical protein [Paraburkholderia phenazinium]SDH82245.1 hypothetical protein SAMN05216466_113211 [Paraburkholderia phenazinium]
MALLRERIRRLEDGSVKAPVSGIDFEKAALMRRMIREGLTYQNMTPEERETFDRPANFAPWKPPADWCNAVDLRAKIRGLPDAGQPFRARDDRPNPDQPEDDEEFDEPEAIDKQ